MTPKNTLEAMAGIARAPWAAPKELYALFDEDVDREQGLHSWVTRFGERGAFTGARVLHLATIVLLAAAGIGLKIQVIPGFFGV